MKAPMPFFFLALLVAAAAIAAACGSSSNQQNRALESISINPPSATANGSPVQFTATGNYSAPPVHVTPQPNTAWGACYQGGGTTNVSVNSGGMAQCATGASGDFTVFTYYPGNTNCVAIDPCGNGACIITGSAKLTCP